VTNENSGAIEAKQRRGAPTRYIEADIVKGDPAPIGMRQVLYLKGEIGSGVGHETFPPHPFESTARFERDYSSRVVLTEPFSRQGRIASGKRSDP
jgi:hypothetical protein